MGRKICMKNGEREKKSANIRTKTFVLVFKCVLRFSCYYLQVEFSDIRINSPSQYYLNVYIEFIIIHVKVPF